jgi:transposase
MFYLGIDVAKAKLDCALRLDNGKYKDKVVKNEPEGFVKLGEWLRAQGATQVHVCMEATGVYWEGIAAYLAMQGMTVSVVNPAQIKAYGASRLVRTKTDRVDARLIAEFCRERQPNAWQAPSASEQALRALVLRLEALQNMLTQEGNRLLVAPETVKHDIAAHVAWLENEIKKVKQKIGCHIDSDPDMKGKQELLDSIPGVGPGTIAMLLAFSLHPGRFDNARQATAYAGLDPRQHQSGSSVNGKPRMSKVGHSIIRKALYMPSMSTLNKTAWGRSFNNRLRLAGKPPKLVIGAMMRKLIHVAFGVLKSKRPFDPELHPA